MSHLHRNEIDNTAKLPGELYETISNHRLGIYIGRDVEIGEGTKMGNNCDINTGCKIGRDCNLQYGTVLNSNTVVGDRVFFAGRVTTADEKYPNLVGKFKKPCVIEDDAIIGLGATLVCCRIGKGAVVGAGALVLEDVPANQVWIAQNGLVAKPLMMTDDYARYRNVTRSDYDHKRVEWEERIKCNLNLT